MSSIEQLTRRYWRADLEYFLHGIEIDEVHRCDGRLQAIVRATGERVERSSEPVWVLTHPAALSISGTPPVDDYSWEELEQRMNRHIDRAELGSGPVRRGDFGAEDRDRIRDEAIAYLAGQLRTLLGGQLTAIGLRADFCDAPPHVTADGHLDPFSQQAAWEMCEPVMWMIFEYEGPVRGVHVDVKGLHVTSWGR